MEEFSKKLSKKADDLVRWLDALDDFNADEQDELFAKLAQRLESSCQATGRIIYNFEFAVNNIHRHLAVQHNHGFDLFISEHDNLFYRGQRAGIHPFHLKDMKSYETLFVRPSL